MTHNNPTDGNSLYLRAIGTYARSWVDIRLDALESQYTHLMDLSTLNKIRLSNHRVYESPGLRNAHRKAYARCVSDKRLSFGLELARQMRRLLKGPGREEYRLRMAHVGDIGTASYRRSMLRKTTAVAGGGVGVWRGRLRPRRR